MSQASGHIQTVCGKVSPHQIGITHPHEHLLLDFVSTRQTENPAKAFELWSEPITLANYSVIRRYNTRNRSNQRLDSVADAIAEAALFKAAGGSCLVEVTSVGLGPRPSGLKDVAQATGLHIVRGCGFYVRDHHPPYLETYSVEQIAEGILDELDVQNAIPAGIIGEIGLSSPIHPVEAKVLEAALQAQKVSGVSLTIHPGRHPSSPLEAIALVDKYGGDLSRTIIGHMDRTLFEEADFAEVAQTGVWVELDLFGREASYYDMAPIDMPNDARRVDLIAGLIERGFMDRILVSQDICLKTNLRRYGGEGYAHIIESVVPLMKRKGFDDATVTSLLIHNPVSALVIG